MVGSVRVYNAIHTIIEGKSERDFDGYRLLCPFKELQEFADSFELAKLDEFNHRHVPYFVLLIQFLKEWKEGHGGQIPKNFAEKQEFGKFIQSKAHSFYEEENFQEAVKFAHKAFLDPKNLPGNVEKIFASPLLENITDKSSHFWIQAAALKKFYEKFETLPVRSTIPDIVSDTDNYLRLKKIYEKKAEADRHEILTIISNLISKEGVISDDELKVFCDNIFNIDYIAYRSISEEFEKPNALEVFETDCYKWHFALRANSKFYEKYGRWPSLKESTDVENFKSLLVEIQKQIEGLITVEEENDEISKELARFNGSQLHTTAAFLGGVASQEAIKLLTHQFKPINHTYVFNGIKSEAEVYEF